MLIVNLVADQLSLVCYHHQILYYYCICTSLEWIEFYFSKYSNNKEFYLLAIIFKFKNESISFQISLLSSILSINQVFTVCNKFLVRNYRCCSKILSYRSYTSGTQESVPSEESPLKLRRGDKELPWLTLVCWRGVVLFLPKHSLT